MIFCAYLKSFITANNLAIITTQFIKIIVENSVYALKINFKLTFTVLPIWDKLKPKSSHSEGNGSKLPPVLKDSTITDN